MTARVARTILLLAIVASAFRFYLLRHAGEFVDESAEMATGWLLSEGETLYGTVFSHHMPLAVAISHGIAAVSSTDHPAHFRVAPWAATVLLALAVAFGPLGRRRAAAGALAAAALLTVVSALAPMLLGHMVLNEVFWGAAFAISFVLVPLPLLFGESPGAGDALAAGAAATLALAGSPLAAPPLAIAALLAATACPLRTFARIALGGAAGALGMLALLGAWAIRFADLPGFRKEVLEFNSEIYARFVGLTIDHVLPEMTRLWRLLLANAPRGISSGDLDALLVLPMLAVLLLVPFARGIRRAVPATALLGLLFFSLRMRDGGFHAWPLHLAVLAAAAVLPWAGGFRRPALVSGVLVLAAVPAVLRAARSAPPPPCAPDVAAAARYVREHTAESERIAAFPTLPIVHLEARRRPATDALFYLPWQAMREDRDRTVTSVCDQLRARPPRYVVLRETTIWNVFPWRAYAPCLDRFIRERYTTLPDPELGGLVRELRPEPPR